MSTQLVPENATRKRLGRPPIPYDPEIAQEILHLTATTTLSLRAICEANDSWPSDAVIRKWLANNAVFKSEYALAREQQMLAMADEIIEIADNDNADLRLVHDPKSGETRLQVDGEAIQRSKIRIDTRRFVMAKLAPRIFGDSIDVTSGGKPLAAPNAVTIDARIQSIMLLAEQRKAAAALMDD